MWTNTLGLASSSWGKPSRGRRQLAKSSRVPPHARWAKRRCKTAPVLSSWSSNSARCRSIQGLPLGGLRYARPRLSFWPPTNYHPVARGIICQALRSRVDGRIFLRHARRGSDQEHGNGIRFASGRGRPRTVRRRPGLPTISTRTACAGRRRSRPRARLRTGCRQTQQEVKERRHMPDSTAPTVREAPPRHGSGAARSTASSARTIAAAPGAR